MRDIEKDTFSQMPSQKTTKKIREISGDKGGKGQRFTEGKHVLKIGTRMRRGREKAEGCKGKEIEGGREGRERERGGERERERQRESETERERQRDRDRQIDR